MDEETRAPAASVVVMEAAPAESELKMPAVEEKQLDANHNKPLAEEATPDAEAAVKEANVVDREKKALDVLKHLVQAALANNEFNPPPPQSVTAEVETNCVEAPALASAEHSAPPNDPNPGPTGELIKKEVVVQTAARSEGVSIWGFPLVGDERSDAVLLKFLLARDFKPAGALAMLKDAVLWRKRFGVELLLQEDLGLPELDKVVFTHGADREGHPVCYNVYGEFQNRELYEKAFGDAEKRRNFLRWRIQYLEKGIRERLDFAPGGISSMVQVTDLNNSPRLGKHRQVTKLAVALLQDNYPEFIAKKVFINVPWWYLAVNRMMSPFFTQRTKSKFVFAGPSRSAETLFKYIAPEQVPIAFGGLSKEKDPDFSSADAATEATIKPLSNQAIEIPVAESCLVVWELRVLGWEVSYGSEFTPSAEGTYTVIVHKARKLAAGDDPVMKGLFKVGEAGKLVIDLYNPTSKKKKLLYRYKLKSLP